MLFIQMLTFLCVFVVCLGQFIYFFCAPTLCYEPAYPRSPSIRWTYVAKEVFALLACLAGFYVLGTFLQLLKCVNVHFKHLLVWFK